MWLIFTDAHLKEYTAFASVNSKGINTRLIQQVDVINQIRNLAKTHKVSNIFFLGDMFDSQSPTISKIVYNTAFYMVQSLARVAPVYLLTGNHDIFLNIHIFTPFTSIENVEVITTTTTSVIDNVSVDMVPWGGTIPKRKHQSKYCFGHFGLKGSIISSLTHGEIEVDPYILRDYQLALAGHYHTRQQVTPNAHHIGAMMGTTFSATTEDRGAWLLEPSAGSLEFIAIPSPKFYTYDIVTPEDIDNFYTNLYTEKDYFKLRLKSDNLNILDPRDNMKVEYDLDPKSSSEMELADPADILNIKEIVVDFIDNSNTALDKSVLKTRAIELLEAVC